MALPELEKDCPCSKIDCPRHKNCVECIANHSDKPNPASCMRPETNASAELLRNVEERLRLAGVPTRTAE